MSFTGTQLDAFAQLATALGILTDGETPNAAWFGDPVGRAPESNTGNPRGLRTILANDEQREALLAFVDEVLGAPDRTERDGATWVPLFRETTPQVTIYAVVRPVAGAVHLGVGIEHATTGAAPTVATRLHVPIFQLARGTASGPADSDGLPGWLLLGRVGGRIQLGVDLTLRDGAPPAGEASLGGLALGLDVPTAAGDAVGFALALRDLQLPGASAPRSFALDGDSLAELQADAFALIVGLVRAQADALDVTQPALRPFAALTGLLGLREVAALPPLPLAELTSRGLPALVGWIEGVLLSTPARTAWLQQLALLTGATVDVPRTAVTAQVGPVTFAIGVRVAPGTGGHPVLTPWAELALDGRAGARVRLAADLLRADTQTGAVTAIPDLRAEAVFGQDAGGAALLTGDPAVGSLHVGVGVTGLAAGARRPAFVLTLEEVTLAGRHHPHLDLSSPEAALDAASTVVNDALGSALAGLGAAGTLVSRLLGLTPPAGIPALSAPALVANPVAEVARYWRDLSLSAPAMSEVLGHVRPLLVGGASAPVPGAGTRGDPWRVALVGPLALRLWRDGDELLVDAAVAVVTPVFDAYEVEATLGMSLLRAGFSPARATFAGAAHGRLELRRADGAMASLALANVALEARRLALDVGWSAATGLRVAFDAESLALLVQGGVPVAPLETRIDVPLPSFDAEGRLVFPVAAWDRVERAIAALAGELHVPPLDLALSLLGWTGTGPRLPLAALVGADPALPDVALAVRAWLGDLALDCARLEAALGPVATLLSGFSRTRPLGTGSARTPYRCPIAGHRRAPGLVAWLEPGCPPTSNDLVSAFSALHAGEPPDPATLVAQLVDASDTLPDVRDLLVGRDGLAAGLTLLAERWIGSDGVVVAAAPDGVTTVELAGYSYDELVALGSVGALLGDVLDPLPAAVVHVGCEPTWSADRPAGRAFDLTGTAPIGAIPPADDGEWYVRLPLPAAAAIARPDRGAVGEQAARLAQLLAARTAPIVVVAYGAAGAAAVRAASAIAAVRDVVTVGTPWAGLGMDALRTGGSGDALRFLARLLRPDAPAWPDALLAHEATPLRVMRGLVTRALALVAGEAELPAAEAATGVVPSAGGEARRAGLGVHAVFGALDADAIAMGFAAVFADGLSARLEAAQAAAGAELPHVALHVGVDVPVLDLNLGGLLVGAGATLELASLRRPAAGIGLDAEGVRGVAFEVHLGVHDGWLVGGPGALQRDVDVRWMSAHVRLPLDGRPSRADDVELVLHEARAFGTFRERWVVRADGDGIAATTPLPEVRVILSQVVARLRDASPAIGQLLELLGLVRDEGLDPAGLDRLLYDVQDAARTAMQDAVALATSLRALVAGATGSGATLAWTIDAGAPGSAGTATVTFDLASRTLGVAMQTTSTLVPPLALAASLSPAGPRAELAFGALDPRAGGLRLVGRAGAGVVGGAALQLEWQRPAAAGAAVPRLVPLLPTPDAAGLQALATAALPAALVQAMAGLARTLASSTARPVLDGALDVLGLLGAPDLAGLRRVRFPLALLDAPGAWLRDGLATWRADPVGSAVALLDAVTPLVAPGAAPGAGWPLSPEVAIRYGADAGRLRLALDVDWTAQIGAPPTTAVATRLLAGLLVGPTGSAAPILEAGVTVAGRGLQLGIAPAVRLDLLRPPPAARMPLYPGGPGLGAALGAVAESVLPPVLNALAGRRADASPSLVKDVGAALFDLGGAMELRDGDVFTSARLALFAADPAARLLARLPHLVNAGVAALAHALDPLAARVAVAGPTAGRLTLGVGGAGAATDRPVRLVLDGAGAPALVLQATLALPDVGDVVIEELHLSAAGVRIAARVGPAPVQVGPLVLRPMVSVRAGASGAGFTRMLGIGLALDAAAASSVEFRWTLDGTPPSLLVVTRGAGGEVPDGTPLVVASRLLAVAASLAGSVAVEQLRPVLPARARDALRGVVFTDAAASTALDPQLFLDLTDGLRLLARLERLLLNLATGAAGPLALTIDGIVTIALAADTTVATKPLLGVSVTLVPNRRFAIASGDPTVELEVDASWVNGDVEPGLAIYAVEATLGGGLPTFAFRPAVTIAGIGLRFSKTSGPLLDLGGVSLDAIAVHVYGEASAAGVGGGVQLELAGFAVAPAGAGGSNAVANGILNDASAAGQSNRPAFSPALAVQKAPGGDVGVSFRAGRPPGPWWVVVQRQLGPLYVERVGLDTAETDGRVSRVALLFDGRVSLFGLTAAVDQLSLTWLGGDILRVDRWAVDLQGLAVSADMSGVSLAGGLLKTTIDGNVGYVGMLLGRFGVYGLSVFGGYTNQNGAPSFFVFGALNGPIGGPPAFFLTGIGGGLGINRGLRVPSDLSRFNEYPFIQALDVAAAVPEPMEKLRELTTYFPPQAGNFWFAAGISFTSFALVDGIAVVAVSFGTGLEINLMGLARMALPRPQAALVSIELGLLARFSTTEGLFSIQAQLTENSWLLYRDVRLTGGFAFVTWWKGALAGQFVLTIGGYHPSFHREGYPVVPRLGLVWRVTDDIVVKGGAYFALTSEALMAGVDVEVSADFGWAWARIAFGAHGIVYFDPFWFEVMAYARVAAGVKIKTWLGTIRFNISMGARIKVWGPDFSGEATLEVGPCEISVGFGSERRIAPRVLDWTEFTDKYLESAGDAARVLSSITGKGTLPASTQGGTSAPTPDGTVDLPFEVFAEFELSVVTTVPTQRFDIGLASGPVTVPVVRSDGAAAALGLKPMQAGGLQSTLRLTLEKLTRSASGAVTGATAIPQQLRRLAEHRETGTDAFPVGAWGAPDPVGLDTPPLPQGDVLVAGSRLRLEAVATQLERGPEIDYYRVEAARRPLPLQARGNSRPRLLDRAEAVALPAVATAADALLAARAQLFAPRADAAAPGLLARGPRTHLARAAFAGDRAAPPMFGTLADGLARANGADAATTVQLPPTPPPPPPMRAPRVVAWLTAGTGVAQRETPTTVRDRRIKRRVAPTLLSVQTRLAMHLPVQMVATPRPATERGRTVIPTATVPRTDVPGAAQSYVAGRLGGLRGLDAVVGGLAGATRGRGARGAAQTEPQHLASGDLVVLTMPDASRDVDERASARPVLAVVGGARVTMVRGDGAVLLDAVAGADPNARATELRVPPGTAVVGVQSDGRLDVVDGLAGWHEQARVASLGSHLALGTGCTLTIEAARAAQQVGWMAAADVVRDAASVTTRFDRSVRTVVVIVGDAEGDRLDGIALTLRGATRVPQQDGTPRPPTVVLAGAYAALVYAVDPGDEGPVLVGVRAGGDYRIAGVLAGTDAVDRVARLLAERGITAVAGRMLAGTGAGCTVRWIAPKVTAPPPTGATPGATPVRDPRARRKTPAKTVTKAAAKTTTKGAVQAPADSLPTADRKPTTPSGGRGNGRR
jgi:hypothetical protein